VGTECNSALSEVYLLQIRVIGLVQNSAMSGDNCGAFQRNFLLNRGRLFRGTFYGAGVTQIFAIARNRC